MINANFSILWGTRPIRFPQICLYVHSVVKHLKGVGFSAHDRIGICAETSVEYVIFLLGIWQSKMVAVPLSPRWPDKTIAAYTARLGVRQVFRSADIQRAVCFDARHQADSGSLEALDLNQDVIIMATSGSSGEPKAVLQSWGNLFYNARGSNETIALDTMHRWLLSLPLYHVSGIGILVRCLLSGACLVIAPEEELMAALTKSKATHVSLVATQLQRLLKDEKNHAFLKSMCCLLLGGSAIPRTLIEQSAGLRLNVYLSYGLTETASQVATGQVVDAAKICVKVLPYRQIKISPEGEICVKGEVLFKGYVSGSKIHLPLVDGWFATGDVGSMDPEGCLTVTGRRDNMFISGGENIHPEEIEKALLSIQGIAQAMVVPRDDKEFGHRPIAFILFTQAPIPEEKIIKILQAQLPRFKIPTAFLPWPEHFMAQGLKISRQEFLKNLPRRPSN